MGDWEEMLRYAPDSGIALAGRARCLALDGQREAALRDWARASELAPGERWIAQGHGKALVSAGRSADAAALYERFLASHPEDPELVEALASLYRGALRRPERARDLLAGLVAAQPDRASAWREYGSVLADLGDPRARIAYEKYLAILDPADRRESLVAPAIRRWLAQDAPPADAER